MYLLKMRTEQTHMRDSTRKVTVTVEIN